MTLLLALLTAHASGVVHDGSTVAPLTALSLDVAVDGRIAEGVARYTFAPVGDGFHFGAALPEGAAVVGLRVRLDGTWIDATAIPAATALPTPDGSLADLLPGDVFSAALPGPSVDPLEVELSWQAILAAEQGAVTLPIPLSDGGLNPSDPTVDWSVEVRGQRALERFEASVGSASLTGGVGAGSGSAALSTLDGGLTLSWTEAPLVFGLEVVAYKPGVDPFTGEGDPDGYALFTVVPGPPDRSARVDTLTAFVVDSSASMQGRPMRLATESAQTWLEQLEPDDRFNLVPYTSIAVPFQGRSPRATEGAVDRAVRFLERQRPAGLSDPTDGLVTALALLDDTVQQRSFFSCGGTTGAGGPPVRDAPIEPVGDPVVVAPYVVWITDGGATIGALDTRDIVEQVVGANAVGASVFAVGVGDGVDRELLEQVTAANRGEVRLAERVGDVPDVVAQLRERIADPVLVQPTASLPGATDLAPAALPDATSGTELVFALRYSAPGQTHLRLTGLRGQGTYDERLAVVLPSVAETTPAVARVWAQLRVADLDRRYLDGETALLGSIEQLVRQYGVSSAVVQLGFVDPDAPTADGALGTYAASDAAGCGCATDRGLAGGVPLLLVGLIALRRRRRPRSSRSVSAG